MTRVRVQERVGGRRIDADDSNGAITVGAIEAEFLAKAAADSNPTNQAEFLARAEAGERETQRQIAEFSVPDAPAVSARDAYFARQAALSRQPAGSRPAEESSDDDDEGTISPAISAGAAWIDREAARNRGRL